MQITDHNNAHYGKRSGFLFWIEYDFINQIEINFSDFAAYLVACGEFDGYDDSTDDGEVWRSGEWGGVWTFNQVIEDFLMTQDFDELIADYIKIVLAEAKTVAAVA